MLQLSREQMWWADNNGSGFEGGLMASRVSMKVLNFRFLSCETGCNASNCRRWRFLLVLPSLSSLSLIIPSLGAQWVWSKTGRKAKALVGNSTIQKLCPEVGGSGARDSEVEGRGVRGGAGRRRGRVDKRRVSCRRSTKGRYSLGSWKGFQAFPEHSEL